MQVTTSYKIKILEYNSIFKSTLEIYRSALTYLIDVVNAEYINLLEVKTRNKEKMMIIEKLVHGTAKRSKKNSKAVVICK